MPAKSDIALPREQPVPQKEQLDEKRFSIASLLFSQAACKIRHNQPATQTRYRNKKAQYNQARWKKMSKGTLAIIYYRKGKTEWATGASLCLALNIFLYPHTVILLKAAL